MSSDSGNNVMEVDNEEVANTSVTLVTDMIAPTFLVSLHPLVILNISEHYTRLRAQAEGEEKETIRVFGALIGKQKGRDIEIMNSFELNFEIKNNRHMFNFSFYENKEKQFKQVFPDLDFLGWYTNGDDPDTEDMLIHSQVMVIHESPLLLKLNPMATHSGLPIKVFESVDDKQDGNHFLNISYNLVTEEAERIGLDHIARKTATSQEGNQAVSAVVEHLNVQYNAVKMLRERIKLLTEFVKEVKAGNLEKNNEIMRSILNLTIRMSFLNADIFHKDFYIQCNDVALINTLGTITKCTNILNKYINNFTFSEDRQCGPPLRIKHL